MKRLRRRLSSLSMLLALVAAPAFAGQSAQNTDEVPPVGANHDNPSHPLGDAQNALRARGLQAKLNGKAKGKTHQEAHEELLQTLSQQNQGQMKAEAAPQAQKVGGQNGLLSRMISPSPYKNDKEHDYVVSVPQQNQLVYIIFIGPESRWTQLSPVFSKVLQSVKFSGK